MTPTATLQPTDVGHPETVPLKPDRDAVVELISATAHVNHDRASAFLDWVTELVVNARSRDYATHYLTTAELREHHAILDAIAPDRAASEPGSAHAALEGFVLDPNLGEMGLLHDKTRDVPGERTYCTVQTLVSVVR